MRKLYSVGHPGNYHNWMDARLVPTMEESELVMFTGGEDLSPSLYGEPTNPTICDNPQRDIREKKEFDKAVKLKIPIVAICRGSQGCGLWSGARIVQNQGNPHYMHPVILYDGRVIQATSSHHNAQFPFEMDPADYKLIAWTKDLCGYHEDGNRKEMNPPVECEIVYYPKTNVFSAQMHPEWITDHPDIEVYKELLDKFLSGNL